jgi:hypothetical protein
MSPRRWSWRQWIVETFGLPRRRRRRRPSARRLWPSSTLRLEALEERLVPSIVTSQVNTTNDAHVQNASAGPADTNGGGEISLRSAIEYINRAVPGNSVVIDFAAGIRGGTIKLNSTFGELQVSDTSGSVSIQGPSGR